MEQKKRNQNYYTRKRILDAVGEGATADDVLVYLLGDHDGCSGNDYVVYKYEYGQKRSILNRINYCWVWPLFLLSIPFSWLITGNFGVNRNSKIGRAVNWLVKLDQ